jgi:FkbM family methyltransferase
MIIEGKEMVVPPADKWNTRGLIDPTLFALMAAVQNPLCTTIDVGANIGAVARYLALRSQSPYIAIEAGPTNFACLVKNTEDIPRVEPIHAAVGMEESVEFLDGGTVCDHIVGKGTRSSTPRVTVPGLKLDSLELKSRVGLLKIDAEGYDYHVLSSGMEMIRRDQPIIFIEIGDQGYARYGSSREDVFRLLRGLYRNPVDRFGDLLRPGADLYDIIFLPKKTYMPRFGLSYRRFLPRTAGK